MTDHDEDLFDNVALALDRIQELEAILDRMETQERIHRETITMTRDEMRAIVALWNLGHPSEPYRIEVSEDGLTERLIRHDGTVAVTAHLDPRHITDFGSRWPSMSVKILNS